MLKFYTLEDKYNNFLKMFDERVMSNYNKINDRPYVGLLFKINNYNYYAPMTSPKVKHKTMNNSIDFMKIDNGNLGAINFNNMIPVNKKVLNYIDINNIKDEKYKMLLDNQFRWINKNYDRIIIKANKLYQGYINNKLNHFVMSRCCNFKLLEEKCKLYIPEFYIYQDREQGKLVVFSEEKNEPRYNLYGTAIVPEEQVGVVRELKQLSDKTTFALVDENGNNKSFYSTKTNAVYKIIDALNNALVEI